MPKKTSHIRFSSFSKIDCQLYFSSFFLDLFGILTVLSSFVCFVKFSLSCCNHFTCHLYSYSIILFYSFLQICTGICEGSLGQLKIFIQLFFLFQHSSLSLFLPISFLILLYLPVFPFSRVVLLCFCNLLASSTDSFSFLSLSSSLHIASFM